MKIIIFYLQPSLNSLFFPFVTRNTRIAPDCCSQRMCSLGWGTSRKSEKNFRRSPSTVINIFVDSLLVIVFISSVFSTNVTLTFDAALEKRMQVARMKNYPRIPETYAEMADIINKYSKYG